MLIRLYPQKKIMVRVILKTLFRQKEGTYEYYTNFHKLMRRKKVHLMHQYDKALDMIKAVGDL